MHDVLIRFNAHVSATFARVLQVLARGDGHLPFRQSKLTYMLQDSLQARPDCHVALIATLPAEEARQRDAFTTLRYADQIERLRAPKLAKRKTKPS